ncbi:hypothetical protein D3C79_882470 [compost metagenome]
MIVPGPSKQPTAILGGLQEVRRSSITGLHHGRLGGGAKRVFILVCRSVDDSWSRLLSSNDLLRSRPDVLDHLLNGFGVSGEDRFLDDLGI